MFGESPNCFYKKSVLREGAAGVSFGLVHLLRVFMNVLGAIVSFVGESMAVFAYLIFIRRARAAAHEYYSLAGWQPEVHASLKTGACHQTHFVVGDNVTWL